MGELIETYCDQGFCLALAFGVFRRFSFSRGLVADSGQTARLETQRSGFKPSGARADT